MPVAPKAVTALGLALAGAAGCAWSEARTNVLIEGGFAAGVRVPGKQDDDSPLTQVGGSAGAMRWWSRGEGSTRQHAGIGGMFNVARFDLERTDLGLDLMIAPPRRDRRTGFQFRLGPRLSVDGDHAGAAFSAEWSDAWLGSLFAESGYDVLGDEAWFLFGARVNLLFPVTFVEATAVPLD